MPIRGSPNGAVALVHTNHTPDAMVRNRWTPSTGMGGGRHVPESVVVIKRCAHQNCRVRLFRHKSRTTGHAALRIGSLHLAARSPLRCRAERNLSVVMVRLRICWLLQTRAVLGSDHDHPPPGWGTER